MCLRKISTINKKLLFNINTNGILFTKSNCKKITSFNLNRTLKDKETVPKKELNSMIMKETKKFKLFLNLDRVCKIICVNGLSMI